MVTERCVDYLVSFFKLVEDAANPKRVRAHQDYVEGMVAMARAADIITLDMEAELKDRLEHLAEARIQKLKNREAVHHGVD
ncbi:MAG: hypothetical protein Tp178MES00d2C33159851_48 [Prokaryotic dsDNA virus sp.]|nr:MAG: hypothetical protein Tp178MES00d2C33159851_48 [Prokaryotic dsDNA virus sp.]|tara:strand:+ start:73553 stop:73795 length:243 start_codon:yes stop_codon:yes gene_type:complete